METGNKKIFAAALLTLGASSARADVAYEVLTGVGHSNNITRVEERPIDETTASVGLNLEWDEKSRHIEGDALVDLSYVEYLEDTYDGEVLGHATADIDFGIVPERFHWQVSEDFGQAQTDPFAPVTPETRENINYFTTGPDFFLHFGQAMSAELFGRYSSTNYEDSPLDAQRTSLGFAVGRDVSELSHVALNFIADESTFDDGAPGYERRNAYLSYELQPGGRMAITSNLGYTWLQMDGSDDVDGGILLDLSISRQMTSSSLLTLTAAHEFSDAGESLSASGGGEFEQITASADPFESSDASLEWSFNRNRTSMELSVAYNERAYETQVEFDSTRMFYRVDFGRVMRPTLTANLFATLTDEEFEISGDEAKELSFGATFDWDFGRHMGLRLRLERFDRSTTASGNDFEENRVILEFTFRGDRALGSS
jgi:hypothetical protein